MRKPPASRSRSRPRAAAKAADAYHHGDLRQALVETAFAQVSGSSADELSLAQLAKLLGVSQAAPYRHFSDRNALLVAVATKGFREFILRLREAAESGPGSRALSRMSQAYVAFGTRRPGIYRLMFASPILLEASADTELKMAARESFMLLVDALDGAREARDRQPRAVRIWVALHGVVMLANQGLLQDGLASMPLPELVEAILAV